MVGLFKYSLSKLRKIEETEMLSTATFNEVFHEGLQCLKDCANC